MSSDIPSHLKPAGANGDGHDFAKRHHGKTQSHVVSITQLLGSRRSPAVSVLFPLTEILTRYDLCEAVKELEIDLRNIQSKEVEGPAQESGHKVLRTLTVINWQD